MNKKHVFWQALILAILIFSSGILAGYFMELNRTSKIISTYNELEADLLDVQVQENIFALEIFNCESAINELVNFADKTYLEARVLERFEDSAKVTSNLRLQHKKYALLRAVLWTNVIKVKEICEDNIHTVVYFYEHQPTELTLNAEQKTFSRYLEELKEEYGNEILLIPIAGNLDANSIELLKEQYDLDVLPVVLVDEKVKFTSLEELESIREYLD